MSSSYYVVLVTVSSASEAKSIARRVLENRLAACVNLVPKISSIYWWEGKIEECRETLMLMKTREDKLTDLIDTIKQLHSYDIPEIVSLPLGVSSEDYLRWIDVSMTSADNQCEQSNGDK
ncbi:MAG: divalent-cation tolerance protein CutA [Candidatus Bruticola sp.]